MINSDDILFPITKLKALAVLFGDRNDEELLFKDGESFGIKWILDDIVKELERIFDPGEVDNASD